LNKLKKYNDYLNEFKDIKKTQKQILRDKKDVEKSEIKEKNRLKKIEEITEKNILKKQKKEKIIK
jgi:hypothetical protein